MKPEFPAKLYGRLSKTGSRMMWTLTGHTSQGEGCYISDKDHRTHMPAEAVASLIRDGRMEPQDGKEVLAWGEDFGAQLERLGIGGLCSFTGKDDVPSVYWFSDAAYEVLVADPEENWEEVDACWRYSGGGYFDTETRATVNGHYIYGPGPGKHQNLLDYICEEGHVSQPRNVAAAAAELAKANDMTIGALFARYQPVA